MTWTKNNSSLTAAQRNDLGYDNADQLLTAPLEDASTSALIKQYTYGYDLAANRTSERVANKTTTSTPNNVNEIISQANPARTLTYDLNGSLTNDGKSRTFEWDGANRLVAVNYVGTTNRTELSYDGLSRLAKIVETSSGAVTSTTKFVNCGNDKCEYCNANDAVTLRVYSQGQYSGTTPYFYTRDHLGSIREMFKSDGTVVARYDYDSWGRPTTNIGTTKPDFNFTGLYRHTKSNLDLATYRAYDPDLGRWLSRDPIGETGGINLYAYVGNTPENRVDPFGLDWLEFHPSGFQPTAGGGMVTGNLEWHDNAGDVTIYPADSGGHRGRGTLVPGGDTTALPNGNYSVYPAGYVPDRVGGYERDGVGFSFRLTPNFVPDPMRTDLLVHPDGPPKGTAGCIGLRDDADRLREFRRRLLDYLRANGSMSLNVYKLNYE